MAHKHTAHTKNKFNLQYLKAQILRLYLSGDLESANIWYATYRHYGGKVSYKEIVANSPKEK